MRQLNDDSIFIQHEPCRNCGSRDNLARYSDGHAFCFGCKFTEPATKSLTPFRAPVKYHSPHSLPHDAHKTIGVKGWQWLTKYGIRASETEGWLWSEEKQYLIFPLLKKGDIIEVWQARNLAGGRSSHKYITFGPVSDVLYTVGHGEPVVLVEDMLSAVKVGRVCTGVPIFGSNIPLKLLTSLLVRFRRLGIWLDRDKASEALKTHSRASQLGFADQFVVLTDLDPKEYAEDEIKRLVNQERA